MKNKNIIISVVLVSIILLLFWLNWTYWHFFQSEANILEWNFWTRAKYFFILVPAAIWDSVNPCEFAIMFILLQTVLRDKKSKKSVVTVWLSFILAVFTVYLAIWYGLSQFLSNTASVNTLKVVAWILWILVWLASLKDYFWYWKFFRLEVPDSWRPKMKNLIKWITSPWWAFWIWILVSFILLPCTSGPYVMITTHLASQENLDYWLHIYLISYNLIFILPMIIIMFLVLTGTKDLSELKEMKELNVEKMHLVTWVIMLWLGLYIFYDLYKTWFFG